MAAPAFAGRALLEFLDLPLLSGDETAFAPHAAAYASPWPGGVAIYKSATDSNYTLDTLLQAPASIGQIVFDFYAGPTGRWDRGNQLWVALYNGSFASKSDIDVFGGANTLAVENADGEWEIVQFRDAVLIAPGEWKLTTLLRGQAAAPCGRPSRREAASSSSTAR